MPSDPWFECPTRVLLVDDDPTFRDLGTGRLNRRAGLSAVAVSTPRDALAALEGGPVDAVVSDVDMPGADADGGALYLGVRERWPTLPFVFFTGTPPRSLPAGVDLRADPAAGYVRKGPLPERYDALARRIERAVRRDRAGGTGKGPAARAIETFCR